MNVAIISPYFPPSTLAGVHRARHLVKHLPATGWNPIVLCVDEAFHEQDLDFGLLKLVARDADVRKVSAISAKYTRPFGIGEISLRAWIPIRKMLSSLILNEQVHAVLITGSPYFPMLMTRWIKRRYGIPVILDFQDPWVSNWGMGEPRLSKAGLSHQLATWLEPRAVRYADFVTSVSAGQNAEMLARYPWLRADRMRAIPIGGDPDDFSALREAGFKSGAEILAPGMINLSYVGSYWGAAELTVRAVMRGFSRLRASDPQLAARICLNFIGTNAGSSDVITKRVQQIAVSEGIVSSVREVPRRLPYLEALEVMTSSDGLLLLGSGETHYTASKIYPALLSRRPYLSLFHADSSSHRILSAAGGGYNLMFHSMEDLRRLDGAIAEGLKAMAIHQGDYGEPKMSAYEPFLAGNIARSFASIFDDILAKNAERFG